MAWLVVGPSLWKIWVRQLGWWHSQLIWENKTCSKAPISCISFLNTSKEMIQSLLGGWGKNPLKNMFVRHGILHFPTGSGKKNKNHLSSCSSHHQPERKTWDLWPMRFGQQRGPRGFACDLCVPLTGWTELLRVADFLKFCGHNGWPQDGSNQVGRLCQLAGLVHQQTLISFMIYNVGPRDDSSVGEHNYSIVCVFW